MPVQPRSDLRTFRACPGTPPSSSAHRATITAAGLDIAPILSFHQCGGNVGDDCDVPLPPWLWRKYANRTLDGVRIGPDGLKHRSEQCLISSLFCFLRFLCPLLRFLLRLLSSVLCCVVGFVCRFIGGVVGLARSFLWFWNVFKLQVRYTIMYLVLRI